MHGPPETSIGVRASGSVSVGGDRVLHDGVEDHVDMEWTPGYPANAPPTLIVVHPVAFGPHAATHRWGYSAVRSSIVAFVQALTYIIGQYMA